MPLSIDVAIAKTNKYASRDSGDTAEIVERPGGGVSVVVVDGQGSGVGAKSLSLMLSGRAVTLLKEGVRDGVVARAVHDSLIAYRHGKVSASFDIISFDQRTMTVVATRNGGAPMLVVRGDALEVVRLESAPIGLYHFTRPVVTQIPAGPDLLVVAVTDGVAGAGKRRGDSVIESATAVSVKGDESSTAEEIANRFLQQAISLDDGRPSDDMTVVAMKLSSHHDQLLIRRQSVQIPLP